MKPRLLDLFCSAGGATRGYQLAGFHVTGVDIAAQPRYCGDEFHQADAMTYPLDGFDVVHASPPCQHYANVTSWRGNPADHPDLLQSTIDRLAAHGVPFVVENVPEAIARPTLILCGSMFGLKVKRHRSFITSPPVFGWLPPCCHHRLLPFMHKGERAYADAMGCHWMNKTEAREAIPPAYTEWIGARMLDDLAKAAA